MSAEQERMPQRQLGQLMTELGLISEEQLATVLEVQQRSKRPFGQIIVELGFASGAAVAHALAMQSGGALKTEYGFALGVGPEHREPDGEETSAGLPKLRLAPTATQPEVVETATFESEDVPEEAETETDVADDAAPIIEPDPAELGELYAEIERLEGALAETRTDHEQALTRLREEHEHELSRLHEQHEQAGVELESLQNSLVEAQTATAEHARRLAEEQERHATERAALRDELGATLERLAAAEEAAEERDRLRAEFGRIESALAEAQAGAAEHDRLREQVESLRTTLAETHATHEEQLTRLREEQERHAVERDELVARSDELQQALDAALERLAVVGPAAAAERDELRAEVERLEAALAEVQQNCSLELRRVADERDSLTDQLEEARDLLRQAERVRESQIALTAERDRALAELDQLQSVAAEAQTSAEEQSRVLAEAQDHHQADRETFLAQRTVLEEELGNAIEQLATAAATDDERQRQLQLGADRLRDALDEAHAAAAVGLERLDAVRRLAAGLTSADEELPVEEPETADEPTDSHPEPEVDTETEPATDSEPVDYSLFVPGPTGYELVPQTGVPPQPGDTVELLLPERKEPTLFEVVRSGRTLPGGDVCVYLAQV